MSGKRVCSSPRLALESDWGYRVAQSLYDSKNIIKSEDFHLVWWTGLGFAMMRYPKMYRVWMTKHVSEFCGTNVQLYYWSKGTISPKCEFCGTEDEYTMHICRCKEPGRDSMFRLSVKEIYSWLIETLGEHSVATTVEMYLLARGEDNMVDCVYGNDDNLVKAAEISDRLGWDSFLEGRISSHWLIVAAPFLSSRSQYLLPAAWGQGFITRLHKIVHTQWVYRNSLIHYKGVDGLTIPEHQEILTRVEELALVDPETLLPRHRFIFETDFEALGSGLTANRLLWLAEMKTAQSASALASSGTLTNEAIKYFSGRHDNTGKGSRE